MASKKARKNRKDVIDEVSRFTGYTKKDTKVFIEAFEQVVAEMLIVGFDVNLVGFGAFTVDVHKGHNIIHPKTKEVVAIPSRKICKFKTGKIIKDGLSSQIVANP